MNYAAAIDLAISLMTRAIKVSNMILQARAEGRETLSAAQLGELAADDDAARANLVAAIERAKAEGR